MPLGHSPATAARPPLGRLTVCTQVPRAACAPAHSLPPAEGLRTRGPHGRPAAAPSSQRGGHAALSREGVLWRAESGAASPPTPPTPRALTGTCSSASILARAGRGPSSAQ